MAKDKKPKGPGLKNQAAPFDNKLLKDVFEVFDITHEAAAEKTGYAQSSITEMANGISQPRWQIREVLAKAFGIDVANSSHDKHILCIANDTIVDVEKQQLFTAKGYLLRFIDSYGFIHEQPPYLLNERAPYNKDKPSGREPLK